ncbi:transglycosylase SLT domain-containing protein [Hydrogenophaga sp. RWCD_12]|uniref:lytic transglycosylase domain-containing protein n=1 Tax=Hydrogenophaga sp. RWCD_12 TaxID=3391190 RepID=UPI0039847685
MTPYLTEPHKSSTEAAATPWRLALADAYHGFVAFTHNGMALLGVGLAALALTMVARADLRTQAEQQLLGWLLERHDVTLSAQDSEAPLDAADRTLASAPVALPKQQAAVTQWLSRRYRVAQEPLAALVAEAFSMGEKARLDPTLILAVMAIESRFNPYAQSPVGAQGLMQVLTRAHTDKYANFGGQAAAFDPLSNLRVGVKVLQDCIKQAGSVEGGLRLYVGAVSSDGGDYINKVMSEHLRIQSVALGKPMPTSFPVFSAMPVAAPAMPGAESTTQTGLLEPATEPAPGIAPPPAEPRTGDLTSS